MRKKLAAPLFIVAGVLTLLASHSFAQSGDVVISSDTSWASGTYSLDSLTVTNHAKLTLQGANTTGMVDNQWKGQGVTITAASIQVDAGSSISADGQGYGTALGPGGSGSAAYYSVGGSYGGQGSSNSSVTYGSYLAPVDLGSGGGGWYGGWSIGGGAIHLIVSGTLTNNGAITANGTASTSGNSGGSSGGSVYITAGTIVGTGTITANGSLGTNATGGGGRVAIYYTSNSGFDLTSATADAAGSNATAGSTYILEDNANLQVARNLSLPADTAASYTNITVFNGAHFAVGGGSQITVSQDLTVMDNSTLLILSKNNTAQASGQWLGVGVTINANNIQVDSGSTISAEGQGYGTGLGPGGSANYAVGGSYGGQGSNSSAATYGSALAPTDLGSGGGGAYGGWSVGGGAIRMIVAGMLSNNGTISANGAASTYGNSGGASGGSIYITTGALTGSGSITANGNQGTNARGGGGRVAVYYASKTFNGLITAASGGLGAGDGTVNVICTVAQITIGTSPASRSFTVDGTDYSSAQTFTWNVGSVHTIAAPSQHAGSTGTRYVFVNWSDAGARSHSITVPSDAATYTASFSTQYQLTTAVSPDVAGSITTSPSSLGSFYDSGTSVQLSVSVNTGYKFLNWSGNLSGSSKPQSLIMNAPKSVTANFRALVISEFTVGTSPEGCGFTVDSVAYTSTQTFNWLEDSVHTISTSTPQAGSAGTRYQFANWSDTGTRNHNITIPNAPTTYTASFTTQYQLTTAVSPLSAGLIAANPSSADGFYNSGAFVQLTAFANPGFEFSGWSGYLGGNANPQGLTLGAPLSVTASFNALPGVLITVTTNPAGRSFTVDGTTYKTAQAFVWIEGSGHTISTATAQDSNGTRYEFLDWSDGGAASHTIIAPYNTAAYTANFATQYRLIALTSPYAKGNVIANPASADGYYAGGTSVQLTAVGIPGYYFSIWSGDLTGRANPQTVMMSAPRNIVATFMPESSSMELSLTTGAASTAETSGDGDVRAGYAVVDVNTGVDPYGTAVFSFRINGVIVSEAGVPASPPTTSARVFIDYRKAVHAVPGRLNAGSVDINTGIVVVNRGSGNANVTYTLRDSTGQPVVTGNGTVDAGYQHACFIDELQRVLASDFNLPPDFRETFHWGSLDISSDLPLSVLALRGTNNQRNDFLITTTPIADLTESLGGGPIYFPEFVDGGGYVTSLILMNTSSETETGTFYILDPDGHPLSVNQDGGTTNSSFRYSIPSKGVFRLQTDGSPNDPKVGSVRLMPDSGTRTPVGSGVFGYNPGDTLLSESGVPSATPTNHARIYVDLSGNHNTGLAIANISDSRSEIAVHAYQMDGVTPAGTSEEPITLLANGYTAAFADQFIEGLQEGFTGVLDISSATPFAVVTLRSLLNERHDFLMTTFPTADMDRGAPSPIIFPEVVDGGGYVTQFILLSPSGEANTVLSLYSETGEPFEF